MATRAQLKVSQSQDADTVFTWLDFFILPE